MAVELLLNKAGECILIDTIRLESRFLVGDESEVFRGLGKEKSAVNNVTGKEIYRFTTAEMKSSFDSRIMLKIQDHIWTREPGRKESFQIDSLPYLVIELSLHKFVMGHNVFGGSNDLYAQMIYFLDRLNAWFESSLTLEDFRVVRIDYAEAFKFSNKKKVSKWIETMKRVQYPRRQTDVYGNETLYFKGTTSTLKFYHKGPEFKKHDKKRLQNLFAPGAIKQLQKEADLILRVECEVKRKKLKEWFNGSDPTLNELIDKFDIIKDFWDYEVKKVIKMRDEDQRKFDNVEDIENHLKAILGNDNGSAVYLTYLKLQLHEEKMVKESMAERTYYRHKKYLKECGVDWSKATIQVIEDVGIDDEILNFKPQRGVSSWVGQDIVSILCQNLEPLTRHELYYMHSIEELVIA